MTRTQRLLFPALLFGFLLLSFGYFNHREAGWNVNSRLALTYAIVEQGTFAIDLYHDNPSMPYLFTNDKAWFQSHYYSDKPPGLAFAAVPTYWLVWQAKMRLGLFSADQETWTFWTRWLVRNATVGVAAAGLGVLLWLMALRFGVGKRTAFALSVALLWGTMLGGYATLFYGYLPSAFCFMACYWLLLTARLADDTPNSPILARGARLFWAGLLLGLAWFFEMTVGLLGIGLGLYALWTVRRRPETIWKFVAGGLIPVGVFFAYTYSIFGEFAVPYKYEVDDFFREQMAQGLSGVHLPRLSVLYYITVHPFHGLFLYSPVLLLAIAGFAKGLLNRASTRFGPDLALSAFVAIAYFAFTSGYYMWWGGWAAGARHLCPAIPFLLAPIAIWLAAGGRVKFSAFGVLAVLSIVLNFMITAQDPQAPTGNLPMEVLLEARVSDDLPSPFLEGSYPRFLHGNVAANLGSEVLGLRKGWSLVPLAVLVIGVAAWVWRKRKNDTEGPVAASGRD